MRDSQGIEVILRNNTAAPPMWYPALPAYLYITCDRPGRRSNREWWILSRDSLSSSYCVCMCDSIYHNVRWQINWIWSTLSELVRLVDGSNKENSRERKHILANRELLETGETLSLKCCYFIAVELRLARNVQQPGRPKVMSGKSFSGQRLKIWVQNAFEKNNLCENEKSFSQWRHAWNSPLVCLLDLQLVAECFIIFGRVSNQFQSR